MAGNTITVDLGNDDVIPAWRTVIDLAPVASTAEWILIGGLMVYVHAKRGGVIMPRSTNDADFIVDFQANRSSLIQAKADLAKLGFDLKSDERYAYRFVHEDKRKIDVMVADHLPKGSEPRLSRKPALVVPGGAQAIRRRDTYELVFASETVVVGAPDELGALIVKGGAYLIDHRDRGRHLDDGATLFASITDASALDYSNPSSNDRKRLRALSVHLIDPNHASWTNLEEADRSRGQFNVQLIAGAMQLGTL